ncbi:PFL_4695 family integrating conjugative element protein [Hahella ganghwensis]|uniref:PFL_4695 family integrating conjugative element protein n=1 Tax=Hahella ganghwensis TaxID=286420 RepID=UPI000370F8B3|nr:integrating conjugative element protein [Hahella ganghwensis]
MKKLTLIFLMAMITGPAFSEPKILHSNTENTHSLKHYDGAFFRKKRSKENMDQQYAQLAINLKNMLGSYLPVHTPELTFGEVEPREGYFSNVSRPICVIGSDLNSLKWVQIQLDYLKTINAFCWLVEAETVDDLKRVKAHTDGLQVIPVKGSVLVEMFDLQHYPVLITQRQIVQY